MYGINPVIDKILFVKIEALKDHLKKKIQKNNEKLNEIYTTSIDSLLDDDGQINNNHISIANEEQSTKKK